MKTSSAFLVAFFLSASAALAQADPAPASQPQGQYGTQSLPDSTAQKEDRVEVTNSDLPPRLQTALKDERYAGWEEGNVFFERNTNQYIVHIKDGTGTRTFRFDREGEPLEEPRPIEPAGKRH